MEIAQILKLLLDFISNNIWPFIAFTFLLIGRKAISNLLERVTRLSIKIGDASGGVEAAAPKSGTPEQLREITTPDISKPQLMNPEAADVEKAEKERYWLSEMFDAFEQGQVGKAKEIFESHQRDEGDADERHAHEAMYLHSLYVEGKDDSALRRLEELVDRSSNDQQVLSSAIWLSWSYTTSKDYPKAESFWLRAIAKVHGETEKSKLIARLAAVYREMGEAKKGIDLVVKRLQEISDPQGKSMLYSELANLMKEEGNKEIAALALEKVIEFDPANRERLFDAAYLQREADINILSIANYQTLIGLDHKNANAYNNLAIVAAEFDLKGKQVTYFRKAIEEGNTLAMANLANLQISAGFWNEASEALDIARKDESPHENVGNAFYRLKSAQEDEEKKWESIGKKAKEFKKRLRKYVEAYFEAECSAKSFEGEWLNDKGMQIVVERNGQKIISTWTETRGGLGIPYVVNFSLSGAVTRCSAQVTYKSVNDKAPITLFGTRDGEVECYSFLTDKNNEWFIFSKDHEKEFVLTLKRVEKAS